MSQNNPFGDNPYSSPQTPQYSQQPYAQQPSQGDGTGGLIPYKNPAALIAYYLSLLGLIPCLGIFFAIPALVLGIIGLRKRAQNPAIKGSVHAWIGIILGGVMTLLQGFGWVIVLGSAVMQP